MLSTVRNLNGKDHMKPSATNSGNVFARTVRDSHSDQIRRLPQKTQKRTMILIMSCMHAYQLLTLQEVQHLEDRLSNAEGVAGCHNMIVEWSHCLLRPFHDHNDKILVARE